MRDRWKTMVTDWARLPGVDEDWELFLELPKQYQVGKSVTVVSVNTKTGERHSTRVRLRAGAREGNGHAKERNHADR